MKSIVLFRCCDATTPLPRLHVRRRWASGIIIAWLASTVGMIEGIAMTIAFGASTFALVSLFAFSVVSMFLAIPAIMLMPVIEELEGELRARRALPAGYVPISERIPGYVIRMILLFAAATLAAHFLR